MRCTRTAAQTSTPEDQPRPGQTLTDKYLSGVFRTDRIHFCSVALAALATIPAATQTDLFSFSLPFSHRKCFINQYRRPLRIALVQKGGQIWSNLVHFQASPGNVRDECGSSFPHCGSTLETVDLSVKYVRCARRSDFWLV